MDKEQIENVICQILRRDGPDGHIDGYEVIADFVVAIQEGRGDEWAANYLARRRKAG